MKIAQIAPPWIPIPPKNYGGTESVIYNLVEELVAHGHDVTLYTTEDSRTSAKQISFFKKSLLEDGVPWHEHLKSYYHLYKSIEAIEKQGFDIIHTHLSSSADLYLFPLTTDLSIPHVVTLHSHFPFDHNPGKAAGEADAFYMEWASSVPIVAISESARQQITLPLNFAGVVHNGLSMQQYPLPHKPRGEFLMWLGRLSPEKGPHLAIEAAQRSNMPLILAGTIDRSSKETQRYFHDEIKSRCDGQQIRYIGPANLRQKNAYLSRARGFLNPIEWEEPFGMVMIEAMALGCPVISFARGAAPEIVKHGQNGFLVNNLDEMVEYIPRLDEIERTSLHTYVDQHFSARVMAERYIEIYKKVIAQHKDVEAVSSSKSISTGRE
jgi:glycosyltransferase involved in cell wall biosynthesis